MGRRNQCVLTGSRLFFYFIVCVFPQSETSGFTHQTQPACAVFIARRSSPVTAEKWSFAHEVCGKGDPFTTSSREQTRPCRRTQHNQTFSSGRIGSTASRLVLVIPSKRLARRRRVAGLYHAMRLSLLNCAGGVKSAERLSLCQGI